MSNRNIRKAIRSLQARIREHQAKIANEPEGSPLAAHWEHEIRIWEKSSDLRIVWHIAPAEGRGEGDRRHGNRNP